MSTRDTSDAGVCTPVSGLGSEIGIDDAAGLDLDALRRHWRRLYGTAAPVHMSAALLRLAVAYRLQERQHGGLSRSMKVRLANAAKTSRGGQSRGVGQRASVQHTIKPGTRFLREWHGRTHEVTATVAGRFDYRGTAY